MAPMAYGNGSVLTHVEKGGLLWPVQGGWGDSLVTKLRPVKVWAATWPEYGGRGGDVRAAVSQWRRVGGAARPVCRHTWHRPGDPHASCTGTRTRCSTHRAQACLGVRVRRHGGMPTRPGVGNTRDVVRATLCLFCSSASTVWPPITQNFETKVDKEINSKVVDLLILYHFHKGRIAFFSTMFAQIECQDATILGSSE
jgi:hypothetical protein